MSSTDTYTIIEDTYTIIEDNVNTVNWSTTHNVLDTSDTVLDTAFTFNTETTTASDTSYQFITGGTLTTDTTYTTDTITIMPPGHAIYYNPVITQYKYNCKICWKPDKLAKCKNFICWPCEQKIKSKEIK